MEVNFRKMHGNGNDFMVVVADTDTVIPEARTIAAWADRKRGVGFDQLLWIVPTTDPDYDAGYRAFNADGGEVGQCGNGVRCVAKTVAEQRDDLTTLRLKSAAGEVTALMKPDGLVSVDIGEPDFDPGNVPFVPAGPDGDEYLVETTGNTVAVSVVSVGNPHAVMRVADTRTAPVVAIGAALQTHRQFPERVNAGFLQIIDRNHGRLRVYERGVGETEACGTGACAAMAAGRRLGYFDDEVSLALPGGDLMVSWPGPASHIWLTGPATTSFEGKLTV